MKYRALAGLVLLLMTVSVLSGCVDTAGTDAMLKLNNGLTVGQSLSDVQASMSDKLAERVTLYPAKNIALTASGNWSITAQDGGSIGDTDAPFQLMLIAPISAKAVTLAIFFEDKALIDSVWWNPTNVSILKLQLDGTLNDALTSETE